LSSVWNEEEDNYYVHHDILMDSFPLALEWIDFDPDGSAKPGLYMYMYVQMVRLSPWLG
jgi:periodic tryptophan protein 1